ncbi:MAG: hypothetical protein GX495_21430 [Chloroflexi bacterium]|nr:hypothetical protein [Chloroflexota bacterium]
MEMTYREIISEISRCIDMAEIYKDRYQLVQARRMLNNDLPRAIDAYVEEKINGKLCPARQCEYQPGDYVEV